MGNGTKSLRVAVAGRLLCLGFALSSCLLPQNDDPLPEIPVPANRPPRIKPETALPALYQQVSIHSTCADRIPPRMEVAVQDPDPGNLIRIRWVVYDNSGVAGPRQIRDPSPVPSNNNGVPITAPKSLFTDTDLATTGMARRLELIVADGEFFTDMSGKLSTISPTVTLPDGGSVSNTTYYDTYSWTVDTVNLSCQ